MAARGIRSAVARLVVAGAIVGPMPIHRARYALRRAIVALFTCAVLLVASPLSIVAAQDDAPANPQLGDDVTFVGDDGNEAAVLIVEDLVDPFEDSSDDPPRRAHFVLLSLSIENTGEEALEVDPAAVFLQDEDGVLYAAEEDLDLGDEEPLAAADLDAGDDVTGAIGYAVPNNAVDLARVFYRPAADRLLILADLRRGGGDGGGEPPAVADFDGAWPGETEEGGRFNFVVADGGITSFLVNYVCPSGKAWISAFAVATPAPIEDGAFTATGRIEGADTVATLAGTFTSDEEAEGIVEVDKPDEEECDLALAWTASLA